MTNEPMEFSGNEASPSFKGGFLLPREIRLANHNGRTAAREALCSDMI